MADRQTHTEQSASLVTDATVEKAARAQWDALRDRVCVGGYELDPFERLEPERQASWLAETRAGLEAVEGDIIEAWRDLHAMGGTSDVSDHPSHPASRRLSLSYSEERAAVVRRLDCYRRQLAAIGLDDSPYVGDEKDRAWRSGYQAALRDLAEHPEITRAMGHEGAHYG